MLAGPPGTNYAVMKKAFDEGWGAVIAKTVSLDCSKVTMCPCMHVIRILAGSHGIWMWLKRLAVQCIVSRNLPFLRCAGHQRHASVCKAQVSKRGELASVTVTHEDVSCESE